MHTGKCKMAHRKDMDAQNTRQKRKINYRLCRKMFYLDFLHFSQSTNSTADLSGSCCRVNPGTPSNSLATSITVPDANSCPLHGVLSAEGACVGTVLGDFHLLHSFPQRGSISGTVFTGDANLSGALCLRGKGEKN